MSVSREPRDTTKKVLSNQDTCMYDNNYFNRLKRTSVSEILHEFQKDVLKCILNRDSGLYIIKVVYTQIIFHPNAALSQQNGS